MGLSPFKISSSRYDRNPPKQPQLGEPNPWRCYIERHSVIGRCLVLMVRYPDCQNYEGLKILLYRDVSPADLVKQGIDPHFLGKAGYVSPIARFEPTPEGWRMAELLARSL
jgi:hypothetical protein